MTKKGVIFFAIFFVSGMKLFSQEKVYVPNFTCEGCDKQTGYSAAFLFADFMKEKGFFEPILTQRRDTTVNPESFNEARESAELVSTKYFVIGRFVKLESIFYIKITLYATSSGLQFWSDSKQCNSVEDIPIVLKNIAFNVASEEKTSQPGSLEMVSMTDAQKINRIRTNKSFGFIIGTMVPMSEKKMNHINTGFGGLMSFDARNFIFEASAEVYFAKDSLYDGYSYGDINNRYYNLSINTIYPLNTTNSAPFVCLGSGFSYRESEVNYYPVAPQMGETDKFYDHGLLINGGGGYMLKRNSDATLFIYARAYMFMQDFDKIAYGAMLNFALHIEGW